jgi:hypothetical protein
MVAYVSQKLLDAETSYVFVERLCLSLYYACVKFRHYILSSTCTMVSRHDVIKHMLQRPILSRRKGKWAYSLVEYDLKYEPLRATKGQVVADFMAEHMITIENDACMVEVIPWRLFFDGSVCNKGQGVGCVVVSPNGGVHKLSARLEFLCTNNQAEYEGLLHSLNFLVDMGVKEVEALGDSNLVVQQIKGEH